MNDDMIRVCCLSCKHYDGKCCMLKVHGWLAADPETYFCQAWDGKEDKHGNSNNS